MTTSEQPAESMLRRCWRKNRDRWQARFPWLTAAHRTTTEPKFALGCIPCSAAYDGTPGAVGNKFASFEVTRWPLMKSLFQQHEQTLSHRAAMGEIEVAREPAPKVAEFQETLQSVLRRDPPNPGGPLRPDAGRKKRKKHVFCIAEASRILDRRVFKQARAVTVMQDVRKSKLLIRFKVSYRDRQRMLKSRRGILGQASVAEGGSINLRDATIKVLELACTKRAHAPGPARRNVRDEKMLKRLMQCTHFYTADAESAEQKAGKVLRDGFEPDGLPAILEALLLVIKDRPHATRRLTKRNWFADPYLKQVLQVLVWEKTSLTNLIQYSAVFQQWFQETLDKMERCPKTKDRIKNLLMR